MWITSDDEPYKYWTRLAQKLLNEQEHADRYLRDALRDKFAAEIPRVAPMWSDLLTHVFEEVNWHEIAEALLEDVTPTEEKEDDTV